MSELNDYLKELVALHGSDLHLKCGQPPIYRVNGQLTKSEEAPLGAVEIEDLFKSAVGEKKYFRFVEEKEYDFAVAIEGMGRFRGNLFFQKNTPGGVFRLIPEDIPSIDEMG
ncbi:MAG: type IV pili twitching motility protein PilT, partial [Candidatus Omnitrophota bacterium]